MVTSSTLRGPAPRNGAMRKMPAIAVSRQPKPVFQVLESAAIENAAVKAKENRRSDKGQEERLCKDYIPFAFSFPLTDLLICELDGSEVYHGTADSQDNSTLRSENGTGFHRNYQTLQASVSNITEVSTKGHDNRIPYSGASLVSLADFVYSRVISRSIRTFWPNRKKAPNYVLAYVEETLECGHTIEIYPSDSEKLVARKRQCHECQGFFGGLTLKKPNGKSAQAQRSRATGKGIVPAIAFAIAAMLITLALLWHYQPKYYIFSAPDTTFRVIEQIDDYAFVLQRVEHGVPQIPWTYHFCNDYKPLFQAGMSLIWFAYDDRGSCISIAPKDRGYVIDRGSDHWPKLARNCKRGTETTPTLCDGKPRFD